MMSCATVGAYSSSVLTGSVSSSSSVVTPQWLVAISYLLAHYAMSCIYVIEEHGFSVFTSNGSLVCFCLVSLDLYNVTVSMSAIRQVSLLLTPCILNLSSIDS